MPITNGMPATNATLIEILAAMKQISQRHAQIQDFYIGSPDETTETIRTYPLMMVDIQPARMLQFIEEWKFRIYYFDLEQIDNSNRYTIISDARQVLRDIVLALINIYNLDVQWGAMTTPFQEATNDHSSGYYTDITIHVANSNGICDMPTK